MVQSTTTPAAAPIGHPGPEPRFDHVKIAEEFVGRDPRSIFYTIALLRRRVERLEADLEECREFISDQSDVVDGADGEPRPNRALQLASMISETLYGPGGF